MVLAKTWATKEMTPQQSEYWRRQVRGLENNRRDIHDELLSRDSRNEQRRYFRQRFGVDGDALRRAGYGIAHIGDATRAAPNRFSVKLTKALFYKHTGCVLDGWIWHTHLSAIGGVEAKQFDEAVLGIAPIASVTMRAGGSLQDQFAYRYNFTPAPTPVLYAVVQFTDQMLFQITALSHAFLASLDDGPAKFAPLPVIGERVDASLQQTSNQQS